MTTGERIKNLREAAQLKQNELAKKIATTRATISSWEAGINQPNLESLKRLSAYFNVTIDYIAGNGEQECLIIEHLSDEEKATVRQLVRLLEYKSKLTK